MSIQDHIDRSDEFLKAFPILKKLIKNYLKEKNRILKTHKEIESSEEFEKEAKKLLKEYISDLKKDELKEKMALVQNLLSLQGFVFWQPTYGWLLFVCENLIFQAYGKIGGKVGGKISGAKNKAKGSEYFKKIRTKKIENEKKHAFIS